MAVCGNHRPTVGGQGGIFAGDLRQLWGYMRQGICARQSGLWASSTPSARKGYIRRYMRRAWICAFGISLKACLLQCLCFMGGICGGGMRRIYIYIYAPGASILKHAVLKYRVYSPGYAPYIYIWHLGATLQKRAANRYLYAAAICGVYIYIYIYIYSSRGSFLGVCGVYIRGHIIPINRKAATSM